METHFYECLYNIMNGDVTDAETFQTYNRTRHA